MRQYFASCWSSVLWPASLFPDQAEEPKGIVKQNGDVSGKTVSGTGEISPGPCEDAPDDPEPEMDAENTLLFRGLAANELSTFDDLKGILNHWRKGSRSNCGMPVRTPTCFNRDCTLPEITA